MTKAPKRERKKRPAVGTVTSPAARGPAGSHFEGQVGASYLLCMLAGSEPRGLPGTTVDRMEFGRAAEGYPLDDVIVHAHDAEEKNAVLEIQVKRSITFAPSDAVFKKVVSQIAELSGRPDFWTSRHELAIATTSVSKKICGAYQDVLRWAREIGSASVFMERIHREGSANDDMRTFVNTFKFNLRDAGGLDDDETVWKLLGRLQILNFDFTSVGSAAEDLAKERAVRVLHADETSLAGALWGDLIERAISTAKDGGDRDRAGLIEDLQQRKYRLTGDRRNAGVRAALAEASRHALDDIRDRIGEVMLTRHDRITAVREALDGGNRYVEIRGDAGVGKSALLKHFAKLVGTEAAVIVLNPERTTPQGWTAMRGNLGFQGTAKDLLADLATDGGAMLFIDNLDRFDERERITVRDLVREAAKVPAFCVIATARTSFGVDEPSWLPKDALDQLGQAESIRVGELSDAEVEELRYADHNLAALLAEGHPAEDVTRNLFRLGRLAERPTNEPSPRTEIDMAEQWWRTDDGKVDSEGKHRERHRLLLALAEKALEGVVFFDVSKEPPEAIEALIRSETLRELEPDRVTFRHDVLREWAIAGLFSTDNRMLDRLPLDRPASAVLARGVELAARQTLERNTSQWIPLLARLSEDGVHSSWRRAALLALVRSEMGVELLSRMRNDVLANRAELLRELIRTVMAVEVEPAARRFKAVGLKVPEGIFIPNSPSFYRLVRWLADLGTDLPAPALPEVVRLYTTGMFGMLGLDPLTPILVSWLHHWLTEIEVSENADIRDWSPPFGGDLASEKIGTLKSDLRTSFLMFCHRAPDLAVKYVSALGKRPHGDPVVLSVIKSSGSLAQAAPAELAELVATTLIRSSQSDGIGSSRYREAFDYIDNDFHPESPSNGPFHQLLIHAPQHGLALIRRLVDHAVSFYSRGNPHGSDAFTIVFSDHERGFPWDETYRWSREGAGHCALTSALMALKAWAHGRIEAGEDFDMVLADVLGPPDAPAAYLLTAVDLILSHWPASREAAIPFVGCPELLCIDRLRDAQEGFEGQDFFGLNALKKDSLGAKSLADLKQRPSRRAALENVLNHYALFEPSTQRSTLTTLLRRAADRLDPPGKDADFADPEFMVLHALNRVDPKNYVETVEELRDGTQRTGWRYASPPTEAQHLAPMQNESTANSADVNMTMSISNVVEDSSRSTAQFAADAVQWAQSSSASKETGDPDDKWIREEAVIGAGMIAMRDGDDDLRAAHREWARDIFTRALQSEEDPVHRHRQGLRFNQIAIAFAGMIYMLRDHPPPEEVRAILVIAARENPAAAHGFAAAAAVLADVDERLLRSVLRCAFSACVRSRRRWDISEDEASALSERARTRAPAAIGAEMAWLAGTHYEPDWPVFAAEEPRPRRGTRLPGGKPELDPTPEEPRRKEEYTDHQAAALWLGAAAGLADVAKRPWLRELARAYGPWTATANGAGLSAGEDVAHKPSEWNAAYFDLVAKCLPGAAPSEVDDLALGPITTLPDEAFLDAIELFLRSVDDIYFNENTIIESEAVRIRSTLARRLINSRGWQRLTTSRSTSVETHIGPAVAVFLFNSYHSFSLAPPKAYLLEKGIDRLGPFLPEIEALILAAPCPFVALLALDLFEVSPRGEHLPLLLAGAKAWIDHMPDHTEFWIDHSGGRRFCALIDAIRHQEPALFTPGTPQRGDLDTLLAALIRVGVAEASQLEVNLGMMSG